MTTPHINAIGYCANYTQQGEWAFALALNMAKEYDLQLNIFRFVDDPYGEKASAESSTKTRKSAKELIEMEKELRFHYDERLEDYDDVGFRLCEGNEWTELHRCLCKHEFQLLIMANPYENTFFGKRTLFDFARSFVSPVILVGPNDEKELTINGPAKLIAYRVGLDAEVERITQVKETVPYHQL